jgi:aminopeptidase N
MLSIWACSSAVSAQPATPSQHDITLRLDLTNHVITAADRMWVQMTETANLTFILNKDFQVDRVEVGGLEVPSQILTKVTAKDLGLEDADEKSDYFSRAQGIRFEAEKPNRPQEGVAVNIYYHGVMYDTVSASEFSRTTIKDQTIGIVGEEGVFLTPSGIYYPIAGEEMSIFRITTALPKPYQCVTQGYRSQQYEMGDTTWTVWEAVNPSDGIYLIAGKYSVNEYQDGDVKIYTFLFHEDSRFAGMYEPLIEQYLDHYNKVLGPYPYTKFAMVENFFETGYGMPSYTLLGPGVMNMSFVMQVSLPHELLHNWWGNGVFVDYEKGNWCEGLTTYMANYYIKEQEGVDEARNYRRDVLRDYASYVDKAEDYPLSKFVERHEAGDRAIGYGKAMMVFHDLRMMVGDESFYEALRSVYHDKLFKEASWTDFQKAFEWVSGENLDWYFEQWIDRDGAPQLSLGDVSYKPEGPMFNVTAEIMQTQPLFRLQVPVVVTTPSDKFRSNFGITQEKQVITIQVDSKPLTLEVDPDFDLFRRLAPGELPPTVARAYGDRSLVVVLPSKAPDSLMAAYHNVAKLLSRTGEATEVEDKDLTDAQIKDHSLFLLGDPSQNVAFDRLNLASGQYEISKGDITIGGTEFAADNLAVAVVTDHPGRVDKTVTFLYGKTPESIENAGVKLPHYGKYSWVIFQGVKAWERGTWEAVNSPLKFTF